MKYYIIKYNSKFNDDFVTVYHEKMDITPENIGADNKYREHVTSDKRRAMRFYNKREAELVAKLFVREGFSTYEILEK